MNPFNMNNCQVLLSRKTRAMRLYDDIFTMGLLQFTYGEKNKNKKFPL